MDTLTTTSNPEHGKLAALLRRQLRAVPAAVTPLVLGAILPMELSLLNK